MKNPDQETLQALKNLSLSNIESYKKISEWINQSMLEAALSMSEVMGEENTNMYKGRVKELKELSMFFTYTDQLIKQMRDGHSESVKMSEAIG